MDDAQVHAGDIVRVSRSGDACVIEGIAERKNLLRRPPVANVDQAIVVTAITQPPLDLVYIDRLLIQLEYEEIQGVLCINKQDGRTKRKYPRS